MLSEILIEKVVQAIAEAVWNQPALSRLRQPVQKALEGKEFKKLVGDALYKLESHSEEGLPSFLQNEFVLSDRILYFLTRFVVQRDASAIDDLLEDYAKQFGTDVIEVGPAINGLMVEFRESLVTHPYFGAILVARDLQGMTAALNSMRHDMDRRFDEVVGLLNKLLAEPDFKALVEARTDTHVFLSYSSKNSAKAIEIRNTLQDAGHPVWQDVSAIVGGSDWQKSIADGIKRAYAMVLVMSKESNESDWVTEEFLYAKDLKQHIVPIKIDNCEPRFGTRGLHIVNSTDALIAALPNFNSDGLEMHAAVADNVLPEAASEKTHRQLEEEYLAELFLKYRSWQKVYTPLAGVGQMEVEVNNDSKIEIASTGIEMEVSFDTFLTERLKDHHPVQTEERDYDDVLAAIDEMRQLVILGDPGSGKSTTVWRITADYAERAKKDATQPIPVILRMGQVKGSQSIEAHLRAELGDLGRYYDELKANKRLVLFFDGLNELPRANRAKFAGEVKALVEYCQNENMIAIVTCRALDYIKELEMGIAEKLVIVPLDPIRIKQFVNAYIANPIGEGDRLFWALAGTKAESTWRQFQKAVDIPQKEHVFWLVEDLPEGTTWGWSKTNNSYWERWLNTRRHPRNMMTLAKNPFMLFMLTKVFAQQGEIPQNRGELFGIFADFMLQREHLSMEASDQLKLKLADLAFKMQHQGEGTAFSQAQVDTYLTEGQLYSARSASILSEGEPIGFTHQLLQEYFAALRLDIEHKNGVPASQFWSPKEWWEPNEWNETALLVAGLYGDDCTGVIGWLRDANPELTQRCILESGAHTPEETVDALHNRWVPRLTNLETDPEPQARAAVGRAVGKVGLDNRDGVGLREDGLPDIAWREVPNGPYLMGSDKAADTDAYNEELPQREIPCDGFYIARFSVTNAQYKAFMDAGGYDNRKYWTDAGWEHKESGNWQQPEYWESDSFNMPNQPVVGVSWFEAYAYTKWLGTVLTERPDTNMVIRLLREEEWEKAARGTDGRIYPYGNTFDATKANVGETGIGKPSAVGIFPDPELPYDVMDMSGNVYDWCLTKYRNNYANSVEDNSPDGTATRVVRGGSFRSVTDGTRCACRYYLNPKHRGFNLGFRVCCAPIL